MRKSSIITWLCAALLSACGGGDTLTSPASSGTTKTVAVAKVTLASSAQTIAADGSTTATLTAVAFDANNNFVKGATVTFNASAGGLAVTQATTDANGQALATLSASNAPVNTQISVSATASGVKSSSVSIAVVNIQQTITLTTSLPQIPSNSSQNATITAIVKDANNNTQSGELVSFTSDSGALALVNGTTDASGSAVANLNAGGDPTNRTINVKATVGTASATISVQVTGTSLSITGPVSLAQGASGTYNITLVDSANNGIPSTAIAVTSANGNTLSAATVTTNSLGHAAVMLTASKGGNDTVTATALGLSATQSLSVSTSSFSITAPVTAAKINLGAIQPVSVSWTANGSPIADGSTVTFSATRGTLSATTATTTAGVAQVTVTSAIAGPSVITASGNGVSTEVTVDFISVSPSTIAVQASPATIPTLGQSTVTAVVRDANNNLVEGQTVAFTSVNDVTGGSLSPATALTNAQGQAQSVYTASSTASPANGVTIQATVQGTSPAVSGTTTLTVGGKTVFLSLGTGNIISENSAETAFLLPYVLQAIDSGGNPVPGIQVTLVIHSLEYGKGVWAFNGTFWAQMNKIVCPNEDERHNGVYDPAEDGFPPTTAPFYNPFGNQDGILESGDVATVTPATVTTDATGSANLTIQYPEDHAEWIEVQLTATATVTGTASSTSAIFWLPIEASKLTSQTVAPPGQPSPYGVNACTVPN